MVLLVKCYTLPTQHDDSMMHQNDRALVIAALSRATNVVECECVVKNLLLIPCAHKTRIGEPSVWLAYGTGTGMEV